MSAYPQTPAVRRRAIATRSPSTGFTLIELLVVVAIIAILAGISFGVAKGVNERAARAQTEGDLAALSVALEAYKMQYGDYPQAGAANSPTDNPAFDSADSRLFNALAGVLGPRMDAITGRSFVDVTRFSTSSSAVPAAGSANSFLDPWGRRYVYAYKNSNSPGTWTRRGYILFSAGPTVASGNNPAAVTVSPEGRLTVANQQFAADNIYANGVSP